MLLRVSVLCYPKDQRVRTGQALADRGHSGATWEEVWRLPAAPSLTVSDDGSGAVGPASLGL